MSDAYYREQQARRMRVIWIVAGLAFVAACVGVGYLAIFRDDCTKSFDRSPRSVVLTFVNGIVQGDPETMTSCWDNNAYFSLETGCSEVCISRIMGTPYEVVDLQISEPSTNTGGRAVIKAEVTVACQNGDRQTGEVVLDSVAAGLPWRHWRIVHSTFGGPLAEPWCR